jgi:hypothetical protein
MLFKSKFFRVVCVLSLALSLSVAVFADTIRLKDGSIIKGKIVSFNGGKFTVVIEDGTRTRQMNFTADEVESISFDAEIVPSASAVTPSSNTSTNNTSTNNTTAPSNTVITVGQPSSSPTPTTQPTPSPQPIPSPQPTPSTTPIQSNSSANSSVAPTNSSSTSSAAPAKPITINARVLADNTSNGWTNSGFVVQKGQRIKITGSGRVSLGGGLNTTPEGISTLADKDKLVKNQATGGLIAVVGDDNNDFIFIGNSREFTATRDGALFLGVNEGNLNDNTGAFDVKIEIYPN